MLRRNVVVSLAAIVAAPAAALGQTRRRTTPRPRPAPAATVSATRTAGANKVAEQIKLMSRFVYLLGGIANGIATVEEAARRNEAPPQLVAKTQQDKASVRLGIQGFREGLDKLEIEFRTTPELQPFYIKLAGSAAGAARAEEQAAANQFDPAGRTLLTVINRLADVLVIMRQ